MSQILTNNIPDTDNALFGVVENPILNRLINQVVQDKQDKLTFDTVPTKNSTNPITSGGVKDAIDSIELSDLDDFPRSTSDKAVKSKGIYNALQAKQNNLIFDTSPIDDSINPVTSGGVKIALDSKQDKMTFDTTPTKDSTNVVTSGGIYDYIDNAITSAITASY